MAVNIQAATGKPVACQVEMYEQIISLSIAVTCLVVTYQIASVVVIVILVCMVACIL